MIWSHISKPNCEKLIVMTTILSSTTYLTRDKVTADIRRRVWGSKICAATPVEFSDEVWGGLTEVRSLFYLEVIESAKIHKA